jgi:hypothetical protein
MVGMGMSIAHLVPYFGAVKLVIQSKTFEQLDLMEAREAAVRGRLQEEESNRPAIQPARTADQLFERMKQLLGEISQPKLFKAQAEEKFRNFIQQMKAAKGPDYQALFLHVGRKNHPRDRVRTVPMRLLIDGEDLQKLQQTVWKQAYFSQPPTGVSEPIVFDALEYGSGKRLERAFDEVVRAWTQVKINDYTDGDRQDLIDLDVQKTVQ